MRMRISEIYRLSNTFTSKKMAMANTSTTTQTNGFVETAIVYCTPIKFDKSSIAICRVAVWCQTFFGKCHRYLPPIWKMGCVRFRIHKFKNESAVNQLMSQRTFILFLQPESHFLYKFTNIHIVHHLFSTIECLNAKWT